MGQPIDLRKPRVLFLLGAYWPGHDAAGPNQSYRALALALKDHFEFMVVARDRPAGAQTPITETGIWRSTDTGDVIHLKPGRFGAQGLRRLLADTPYDLLVMNGFFDRDFTLPALWFRALGLVPRRPALLSPRGELANGALGLKRYVKHAHLMLARCAHLLSDVWLHATSAEELSNNRRVVSFSAGHFLAANVSPAVTRVLRQRTNTGKLRLAFVGRITRVKNLDFALRRLSELTVQVSFGIYGPISDPDYWAECEALIAIMPSNVVVTLCGEVPNAEVPQVLADFDAFLMPTLGENFGHAIYEALSCGLPVLISDRTPWRNLEAKSAGWDLPLENPQAWIVALEMLARMSFEQRAVLSSGAQAVAIAQVNENQAELSTERMFRAVLSSGVGISSSEKKYVSRDDQTRIDAKAGKDCNVTVK